MKLIEVFNTYQGEGPDSGRQMTIARHRACDRVDHKNACPWCDTLVKMRISCEADYSIEDINLQVKLTSGLMITGGEPSYRDNLDNTRTLLRETDFSVCNIETNGYNVSALLNIVSDFELRDKDIKVIYSPKFFSEVELQTEVEHILSVIKDEHLYLKFVNDGAQYIYTCLDAIVPLQRDKNQIWVMPEGKTREDLIKNSGPTMDLIEKFGVNFSSRNHIIFGFV
jgi:organic radical activating enzyme